MKKNIIKLLYFVFVSLICFSCSSPEKDHEYEDLSKLDFGKGIYRPNPFAFLDNIPPFSWMGNPTPVKKETEFEIQFNEDAIRSKSIGQIAFLDMEGNKVEGITIGSSTANILSVNADSQKTVIPISYNVPPTVGDSILTGHIVIIGENLDQVNDVELASGATPIASWKLTHETGINWLRWLVLILIVAVILFFLYWLINWIYISIAHITTSLSSASFLHAKISQKKANNKKERKEKRRREKLIKYLKVRQDILLNSNKTITEKATALEEMFQYFNFELSPHITDEQFSLMDQKVQSAFNELWKPQGYLFAPASNGRWTGQPKNSMWIPDDDYTPPNRSYSNLDSLSWAQIKRKYNFKGLVFSQGKPNFKKVARKTVEIDDFGNFIDINKLEKRTNLHEAAFAELAKQMNISIDEARKYKEKERLMWHEDSNCRTLYLVPYEIHGNINHFGGIGMYACLVNNKLVNGAWCMYKLKAFPWIGKDYGKGIKGKRVMALGESHYCANPADFTKNITRDVIRDLFDPASEHEAYKNTYAKFINALAGEQLDTDGKREWWNRIAFYNYVQTPMTGARVSPTAEDFKNSEDAFFEVLEQLRPTHVIVWGKRLYENMPDCGKELPTIKMNDGSEVRRWEYLFKDGSPVKLLEIRHPSTGFSTDYWNEAIRLFLEQ